MFRLENTDWVLVWKLQFAMKWIGLFFKKKDIFSSLSPFFPSRFNP